MTRARWILSAASLFALWLLGALVCLPHLQRDLKTAAQDVLSQQPDLRNRTGGLQIGFNGQQARLTGSVRTQEDRSRVENAVRDLVSLPAPLSLGLGRHLNPVSAVQSEVEVIPSPPGWMLLAADGPHARLLGTAANEYEARDLARSVQEAWSIQGGVSEGMPGTDAGNHDEAANVSTTLRTVPAPQASVQAYLARIGLPWKELTLGKSDADLLAEARALGVSEAEWEHQVRPALDELRASQQQQQLLQVKNNFLARLLPGYLFVAVRDQQIILRGEVGSAAMKQEILEDAIKAFAHRRLHDEIRVSAQRRPSGDFGPITTALLPEEGKAGGKSCFLSFSGEAWKTVDWQIAPREQSWKNDLPAGLDAKSLQNDSAMLSSWLQGDDSVAPPPSQPSAPAFIALAVFGTKAIISGQVAEEAVRAQLIAAVRLAYGPQFIVMSDQVHVSGDCEPSGSILHSLKSLPPAPATSSAGMFAIAKPGGTWTLIPVTRELVEAGGLAHSGLLPAGIPAAVVEDLSAETIEQLRLRLAHPDFN
ncbi:MAG: hypothetical protein K9N47_21655 [Prosthecobacter sp.]|uniref:hypothetical protein n=1 Tax=Prosthecobacter sp. TaxID=1965333 RepID=UPI002602C187|nr:hypothetical protein [Prosthecobacter sp.]MCF7788745.1 hypothetical protein [Prosthecobacter sp.]